MKDVKRQTQARVTVRKLKSGFSDVIADVVSQYEGTITNEEIIKALHDTEKEYIDYSFAEVWGHFDDNEFDEEVEIN
jgi:hypothetical protein